ncbi:MULTISPECIES: GNAT family N-acetyltransferase [unclassified Rhizobium]|uniref:GNAT family N-acetyltransferase n=1 Tax=unclassified Rhizobium TaxID=2613769 RepID=UPI000EA9CA3C|nr:MULTISPECIES: GNAT family N-acetyltransferase [unclassified Rhizobium]AYG70055.1 N-acetyltransferase [Rhizobium sp. CCGE531]AYG76430.1 N-acetyltransferase [Rhizobium sp. CCGE532]
MALSGIELLNDTHRLDVFDCGKPALNAWLTGFARANQSRGFTRVLVVHEDGAVVGYYGVAPSVIPPNSAPHAIRTGRPPDPIPCLLIGQLAVDQRYAGRGIGSGLVKDALQRCIAGADIVGGRAVVVRAIDAEAEHYWQSWGFIASRDNPSVLMRSIQDVRLWLADTTH